MRRDTPDPAPMWAACLAKIRKPGGIYVRCHRWKKESGYCTQHEKTQLRKDCMVRIQLLTEIEIDTDQPRRLIEERYKAVVSMRLAEMRYENNKEKENPLIKRMHTIYIPDVLGG